MADTQEGQSCISRFDSALDALNGPSNLINRKTGGKATFSDQFRSILTFPQPAGQELFLKFYLEWRPPPESAPPSIPLRGFSVGSAQKPPDDTENWQKAAYDFLIHLEYCHTIHFHMRSGKEQS